MRPKRPPECEDQQGRRLLGAGVGQRRLEAARFPVGLDSAGGARVQADQAVRGSIGARLCADGVLVWSERRIRPGEAPGALSRLPPVLASSGTQTSHGTVVARYTWCCAGTGAHAK